MAARAGSLWRHCHTQTQQIIYTWPSVFQLGELGKEDGRGQVGEILPCVYFVMVLFSSNRSLYGCG